MTEATLVIIDGLVDDLVEACAQPLESAAVVVATPVTTATHLKLLVREIHWVPDGAYTTRKSDGLVITSDGYVPALARAEALKAVPIWLHTHPGQEGSPRPSQRDDTVDTQLADVFRLRADSGFFGSIVVANGEHGMTFTGRLEEASGTCIEITRMLTVGDRFQTASAGDGPSTGVPEMYDRNVRAFGGSVQNALLGLTIGVVGCGGTGSSVAEQLTRLGVRTLHLFDPDTLTDSNITRVYGSTVADVGRPKTEVLASYLESIVPGVTVHQHPSAITELEAAAELRACDVVFGCTDDNAGRLILSRLSTYYLIPVIDCGVLLSSRPGGELTGIDGRITVLSPGSACLLCRQRVDAARAAAEMMSNQERERLQGEGYAPALPGVEPAVVTFTTAVAATAVSELLERMVGYGGPTRPTELLLRFHEREISTNAAAPRTGHYCDPEVGVLGRGDTTPLLEMTWAS